MTKQTMTLESVLQHTSITQTQIADKFNLTQPGVAGLMKRGRDIYITFNVTEKGIELLSWYEVTIPGWHSKKRKR